MLVDALHATFVISMACLYITIGDFFVLAMKSRTGMTLTRLRSLIIMLHWPLFVLAWCLAPRDTRPATPFSRKPRVEQEQISGGGDWQARWDFFTKQIAEADRENNPVARERAEEHIHFLEETRPPGLKKPKSKPKSVSAPSDYKEYLRKQLNRAILVTHEIPPNQISSQATEGYCNICASHYTTKQFVMRGVCLECAQQQGL